MEKQQKIAIAEIVFKDEFQKFYEIQDDQYLDLKESIKQRGLIKSVVIDAEKTLIDGYGAVRACQELGIKTISVIQLDYVATLDDRLTLNIQRSKTKNDLFRELKHRIENVQKTQGRKKGGAKLTYAEQISGALGGRWKDPETINKIVKVFEEDYDNYPLINQIISGDTSPNAAYEFITNTKAIDSEEKFGIINQVKKGDLKAKDANKLLSKALKFKSTDYTTFRVPGKCESFNIDCGTIAKLSEYHKNVDLIFTSPPYWDLKDYNIDGDKQTGKEETKIEYLERLATMVQEWTITLKESASVMINIGETYKDGIAQRIPFLLIDYIERISGLKFYDMLIWSKKNSRSGGNSENIRPRNNIEYILWFVVNPKKVKYQKLSYKLEGSKPKVRKVTGNTDKNGNKEETKIKVLSGYKSICKHFSEQEVENIIKCGTGNNHQLFDFPKTEHPAVMSALLPLTLIQMTTIEGDLVFDPFSGTNVVGYVSQLLNRRTLTTEKSNLFFVEGCNNLQRGVNDFNAEGLRLVNEIAIDEENNEEINIAA